MVWESPVARSPFFAAFICMVAGPLPAFAQQAPEADPYNAGREIIADIGKIVTPNGVQETFEMTCFGGARQVVNVRGSDRDNPLLIFIHGGPGAVEMPIAWSFQRPWEDFFTVVQYDQRGAGRSYALNDPEALAPTLTPDRYRDDAIELIEALAEEYGKRKVFLLGHSWGSLRRSRRGRQAAGPALRLCRHGSDRRRAGGRAGRHVALTEEQARKRGRPGSTERAGRDPALSGLGTVYDREGRRVEGLCDPFWLACCVPAGRPLLPPSAAAFAGV